jgi:MoxR-like ATPase
VQDYAIRLTLATHPESEFTHDMTKRYVRFGSSPRGTQALVLGAKVHALMNNRVHVAAEDIRAVAMAALRHRMHLNLEGEAEQIDRDTILERILQDTAPPKS